ncbi:Com family DNA-binding transcriptional regulator [Bacillus sp. FSL K6-3431]
MNKTNELKTVRCDQCNKKLGMISGRAEIKCPRCGLINYISKN